MQDRKISKSHFLSNSVRFIGLIHCYNEATKQKEDNKMKSAVINKMELPLAPYPNAATRREVLHKIVDHLLIMASCAGIASMILLMFAMA